MVSTSWITPSGLIDAVKKKGATPVLSAAIFVVIACVYLWVATPLYEARVTLTAREPKSDPLSQIGKLGTSLLGDLGGIGLSGLSDYDKLIDLLISQDTARAVQSNDQIMGKLFRESWDTQTHLWRRPTGFMPCVRNLIDRVFGLPGWAQPGAEPVLGFLEARLRIVRGELPQVNTISLFAEDPAVANRSLRLLVGAADDLLRQRARQINSDNVSFLRKQISTEPITEIRTELSRQLGQELAKSSMLASSSSYSYEILKDFRISSRPVSPRPLLSLLIAAFAGLVVGVVFVILRTSDWYPKTQRKADLQEITPA